MRHQRSEGGGELVPGVKPVLKRDRSVKWFGPARTWAD